ARFGRFAVDERSKSLGDSTREVFGSRLVWTLPGDENGFAEIGELLDRFRDVRERSVPATLLRSAVEGRRIPLAGELLDGRDIDAAVVQSLVESRQILGDEPAVHADRVARDERLPARPNVLREVRDH